MTYEQPDSATFQALYTYEDNFSWYMETDDGYAIIRNPNDSYYYYAQLDLNGEYTWTNLKVGIDDPTAIEPQLRNAIYFA